MAIPTPKCFWNFDESSGDAADATGNGFTLTNTSCTYSGGLINNCVVGNGSSAFLSNTSLATYKPTGDFSFGGWINPVGLAADRRYFSFANNDVILILKTTGVINLDVWDGGAAHDVFSSTTLSTGTWYHVLVTNSGGTWTLYINGVSEGTPLSGVSVGWEAGASHFSLLANANQSAFANAKLDMSGIWDSALSSGNAVSLYNGGAGVQFPFTVAANSNFLAFM